MPFSEDGKLFEDRMANHNDLNFCTGTDFCIDFHRLANHLFETINFLADGMESRAKGERTRFTSEFWTIRHYFLAATESPDGASSRSVGSYLMSRWMRASEAASTVFSLMERCDNLIVADRVSIMANVHSWYRWQLHTNRLDSSEYSLSGCLFALWLVNFTGTDPEQRKQQLWSEISNGMLTHTFKDWGLRLQHRGGYTSDAQA
ncbi:hypothetical protein FB567DRAFT_588003 [Paraphoma chrysanthemicola]|uniref:Uncharacterized protein n=1 Tax=Paraphoma chrysanthemicola TaxID=798071 RepID=A0A8K0RII5_9PLEO|nr:hypothetical protein FB567DRAFT_588003 [Paraphoma chrysanthemicola]